MNKKGFTLIELLTVVAIIAILATIAVTQYIQYREKAVKSSAVSDAKGLAIALEAYYINKSSYPDNSSICNDNASHVDLGGVKVPFSPNNICSNYLLKANGFQFDIVNQIYNKKIIYDSTAKGIDASQW